MATLLVLPATALCEDVNERFFSLYSRVVDLSRKGVEVNQYTDPLNEVLRLLEAGDLDDATELMNLIEANLSRLEARADEIVLMKSVTKYSTVAAILAIPLLTYFLLPRAYVYAWFRSRRGWMITGERDKR
ncbi:MAG: hypothetical protein QXP80_05420 [Zestosphaera sp.]